MSPGSHSQRDCWDLQVWEQGWEAGSKTSSPFSQSCSGMRRHQQFLLGEEISTSLCFTFGARTMWGKESGKLTGTLRGRMLQKVCWRLALSFVNAPFGVFVWTLPVGIREEMRQGEQGAQSRGVWKQPCYPEQWTASRMNRSISC